MIIAFVGQKGGSGKSTLATSTAAELLARGHRVLLVDADPQGTARTWAAVANESGHPAPATVAMDSNMHLPGQLDAIGGPFGAVVIDTPPRHGDIMRSALMVADVAVLPCGPAGPDAWALTESLGLVQQAQIVRPELHACAVLTRKQARTAIGKGAREVLAGCGLPVLRTEMHYRVAYQEAVTVGRGVAQYAPGAAAVEVRSLVDELETFHRQSQEAAGAA